MKQLLSEEERARRNLAPHAAATAAMYVYGKEYSEQHGGSMDFWDSLSDGKKRVCQELVVKIRETCCRGRG